MKVLCITGLPLSAPTVEDRLIPLISNLKEYQFDVLVSKPTGIWKRKIYTQDIPEHVHIIEYNPKLRYLFSVIRNNLNTDYDMIYVSKLSRLSSLPGYILSKIKKKPLIVDCDDCDWDLGSLTNKIVGNFVIKHNDALITASRELHRLYGGTYIPNSTDLNKFDPKKYNGKKIRKKYGIGSDKRVFLWAGILHPVVDINLFTAIGNILRDSYFLIIGDGPRFEELKNTIKSKNVILTGMVPKDEMPEYYAAADAGVISFPDTRYHRCKCPIKLFEFMAMELPVFTTPVGESKFLVQKSKCGLICETPVQFVNNLENISKSKLSILGRNGRKYLEEKHNWEILSKKLRMVILVAKNTARSD
jgi:glycosyltransferase involved in cell wall biosynthesis